jgi:hypothetical protein
VPSLAPTSNYYLVGGVSIVAAGNGIIPARAIGLPFTIAELR